MVQNAANAQPGNAERQDGRKLQELQAPLAVGSRFEYVEAVLEVAALIPPGRVLSYGDIAELLGSGGPAPGGQGHVKLRSCGVLVAGVAFEWDPARARCSRLPRPIGTPKSTPRRTAGVLMKAARWQPNESEHLRIDEVAALLAGAKSSYTTDLMGNMKSHMRDSQLPDLPSSGLSSHGESATGRGHSLGAGQVFGSWGRTRSGSGARRTDCPGGRPRPGVGARRPGHRENHHALAHAHHAS